MKINRRNFIKDIGSLSIFPIIAKKSSSKKHHKPIENVCHITEIESIDDVRDKKPVAHITPNDIVKLDICKHIYINNLTKKITVYTEFWIIINHWIPLELEDFIILSDGFTKNKYKLPIISIEELPHNHMQIITSVENRIG